MRTNSARKTLLLSVFTAIFAMSLTLLAVIGFGNKPTFTVDAAEEGISNVNITLSEDVVVNFHTNATMGDGTKVVVSFNGETKELVAHVDGVFSFSGVTPQHFNDEMTATMYKADGTQIGAAKTLSVQSYLENCLTLEYEDSGCASQLQYTAMKELAVDLLNYGAAAQTYVNHDTENLANKNLTAEQQALATEAITQVESDKAVNGDMWVGAGVRFDYKLGLYFVFKADSLDGIIAKVDDKKVTPQEYTVAGETEKCWVIRYNEFDAINMNDAITATLIVEGQEEQTFTYSIASYVAAMGNEQGALAKLVNATYAYGFAAVAYSAEYRAVKDPTFEEEGLITMDNRGYDFSQSDYAGTLNLPALNFTDYTVATTVTGDAADPVVKTEFIIKHPLIEYSVDFETNDCLEVNDKVYSRYELSLLDTDNVDVAYNETTGYTYHAETEENLTSIGSYGHALTVTGTVKVTAAKKIGINSALYIGTAETPATVTITSTATSGVHLLNGADLTVVENSSLQITSTATVSLQGDAAGSYITVNGELTTSGSIVAKGAATVNTAYEYGFVPNVYVGGTLNVSKGQLITNSLQVGSVKNGDEGILNITQSSAGRILKSNPINTASNNEYAENTINIEDENAELRYAFVKGKVNLTANCAGLTAIDVRSKKSSYVMFDSGITVTTGGTSGYTNLVGCWSNGTDYRLAVHADAKIKHGGSKIWQNGIAKPLKVTYFDTATINLDNEEKTVYVATGYKYNSSAKTAIYTTDLSVDNGDGTKSLPAITPVAGDYTSQTATIYCCAWTFTQAKDATGNIIYYKVI